MGMNVGGKKGGAIGDINVTPLVDVVLVLLIIFMVVTQMLSSGMEVKLPDARTSEEVRDMGQYLVVSITKPTETQEKFNLYIDRTESSVQNLGRDLTQQLNEGNFQGVLIKGSKHLRWKQAHEVLTAINQGGISTMLLATEKE